MISFEQERMIPIQEAPRHLPVRRGGKRIHVSACYRWISRGVRGVVLESIKVGGCIYTSMEALERFVRRLSNPGEAREQSPTVAMRQRRVERATLAAQAELGMPTALRAKA